MEAALFSNDLLLMNGGADPHGCTWDEIGAMSMCTMEGVCRESTHYQSDCDRRGDQVFRLKLKKK